MPKGISPTTIATQLGLKGLMLPLATAVAIWGANGAFPKPPAVITRLARNELFQYALAFIFIWQGGAQQSFQTALLATVILFLVTKFLDLRSFVQGLDVAPQPIITIVQPEQVVMPPLTSAPPASGVSNGPMREGFYSRR